MKFTFYFEYIIEPCSAEKILCNKWENIELRFDLSEKKHNIRQGINRLPVNIIRIVYEWKTCIDMTKKKYLVELGRINTVINQNFSIVHVYSIYIRNTVYVQQIYVVQEEDI